MRNANECRAKDPRTCYYHGAIIEMNEAMERITAAGTKARAADFDAYYSARQRVETAEEELKKQQWMEESSEFRAPKDGYKRQQYARKSSGQGSGKLQQGRGNGSGPVRRTQQERAPQRQSRPVVEARVSYNERVFPQQIQFRDEKGRPAVFTRHDKTSQLPKGLMLAADRPLSDEEREKLVNYVKYQHTISTRSGKELKNIDEADIAYDHTARSVYVRTKFDDAEQLKGFHATLTQIISDGTAPRKDGTQKYEGFGDPKAHFALYYNN